MPQLFIARPFTRSHAEKKSEDLPPNLVDGGSPIEHLASIEPYEAEIVSCRRVILSTGWDKRFPDEGYFGDQPVVTERTCMWLVERRVFCLAMDTPTTYPARYVKTHLLLLRPGVDVVLIEGLCGLERLQNREVVLIALPLSVCGCDGAPCGVVVIEGDTGRLAEDFATFDFVPQGSE